MAGDSSDIDNALMAKLGADATLLGLCPNGVHWDVGPPGLTRLVVVSMVAPQDVRMFGGRAYESVMYLVKAVVMSTTTTREVAVGHVKAAAARIDTLLDPQPPAAPATLTVSGYTLMAMYRDDDLPRIRVTEHVEDDPSILWFHRGGHYWVFVST